MSHKTEIYGNYLRKWNESHVGMVRPEYVCDFHAVRELLNTTRNLNPITCAGKACGWNACDGVFQLPDGRVVELSHNTEGLTIERAAIFPDLSAFRNYDEPMSPRAYFEEF